jgi:hypothetical protein
MKTCQKTSLLFAAASSLLLLPAMVNAAGTTYTLGSGAGLSWATAANWSPAGPPNGVDNTIATTSPNGGRTDTLDGSYTVGNIDADVNESRSYTFNVGSVPSSTLTLQTDTGTAPSVTVYAGQTAGDIYLNAPLAGTQGFTLSGASGSYTGGNGAFVLGAANAITGAITVNDGYLVVNGSLPLGAPVTLNESTQAVLAGAGTVNDAVTLTAGMIFPGSVYLTTASPNVNMTPGTLTVGSLAWNAAHTIIYETLGTSSSLLALSSTGGGTGALTLTGSGTYGFKITQGSGFSTANTYELMTFVNDPNAALPVSEFTGAPAGMQFALDPTDTELLLEPIAAVPEPSTIALLIGGVAGVWQLRRRKA